MLSKYFHFRTQTVSEKGGFRASNDINFLRTFIFIFFYYFRLFSVVLFDAPSLLFSHPSLSLSLVFIILRFSFHFFDVFMFATFLRLTD